MTHRLTAHIDRCLVARRSERGNALFIVVMVITLLTAVGLFAMRSASLSNQAAGYNRQGVQTLYLSEFAARSATAELVGKEQHYFNRIIRGAVSGGDDCRANRNLSLVTSERPPCAKLLSQDIWTRVNAVFPGNVGTNANRTLLGELGSSEIEGAFLVEMTDLAQVGMPVVGEDAGPGRFKHMQVLLTATAQVRPKAPAGSSVTTCQDALTVTSALQTLRARVTFGPVL
jgi:Tfp pilus assembly protein PilX